MPALWPCVTALSRLRVAACASAGPGGGHAAATARVVSNAYPHARVAPCPTRFNEQVRWAWEQLTGSPVQLATGRRCRHGVLRHLHALLSALRERERDGEWTWWAHTRGWQRPSRGDNEGDCERRAHRVLGHAVRLGLGASGGVAGHGHQAAV